MNKKIIAVALVLLTFVVVFTACKSEPDYKVDYTVTLENGDVVDVYEDENGENFVTNVDGDKIPVTSDPDGFMDKIEDLITETTTKKSDKNDKNEQTPNDKNEQTPNDKNEQTPNDKDEQTPNDKNEQTPNDKNEQTPNDKDEQTPNDKDEQTPNDEEPPKQSGVEIGSDTNKGGSIDWDDIVAVP